jgi:hypothetical protein
VLLRGAHVGVFTYCCFPPHNIPEEELVNEEEVDEGEGDESEEGGILDGF